MFKKQVDKDNKIDIESLNHILKTGKNLINIGYFVSIICLVLLGTYLIKEWHILKYIKELLLLISPIFIGTLIAWFFDPFVSKLEKNKVPRVIGCILVFVIILSTIFTIFYLFIPSLGDQIRDFAIALPDIFDNVWDFVIGFIEKFDNFGMINTNTLKSDTTKYIADLGKKYTTDLPSYIFDIGKGIVSGGVNFFLGLMVGFYLLFDFKRINEFISKKIPSAKKKDYNELTSNINDSLRSYIQGLLLVMLLVFITQSIGLTIAGMTSPILFALICALTDVIPYFGPYIGAIPAVIVGFTISPITGVCVIISILVVQMLENNFYQPLIMGHTMKLHPVTIMLGLLFFQHFFGIFGMIIATPCIACLKVILIFILERSDYAHLFNLDDKKKVEEKDMVEVE